MSLGALLAGALAALFVLGLSRPVDAESIRKIDEFVAASRQADRDG